MGAVEYGRLRLLRSLDVLDTRGTDDETAVARGVVGQRTVSISATAAGHGWVWRDAVADGHA